MNHYHTSDGERVAKSVINKLVSNAKKMLIDEQFYEYGYNFCEECEVSSGVYLDCSHTISVDEAQKTRRSELAWDVNNLRVLCRDCHIKHDSKSRIK